jgi:hypothetical protein
MDEYNFVLYMSSGPGPVNPGERGDDVVLLALTGCGHL